MLESNPVLQIWGGPECWVVLLVVNSIENFFSANLLNKKTIISYKKIKLIFCYFFKVAVHLKNWMSKVFCLIHWQKLPCLKLTFSYFILLYNIIQAISWCHFKYLLYC